MKSPVVILYDSNGNEIDLTNTLPVGAGQKSSYSPDPFSYEDGTKTNLSVDPNKSLNIRGQVHTDEGSIRDHFGGAAISSSLTGIVTFTSGSTTVTGTGTSFFSEVNFQHVIKLQSDANTAFAEVSYINSDTELELSIPYAGSNGTGIGVSSIWDIDIGTGGTLSVSGSAVTLTNSTTNGVTTKITKLIDYGPIYAQFAMKVNTRATGSNIGIGFSSVNTNISTWNEFIYLNFPSTLPNTQFTFTTAICSEPEVTTVTLPGTGSTTILHTYSITVTPFAVSLFINDVIVAKHTQHIPSPYTPLYMFAGSNNLATLSANPSLTLQYVGINNSNRLEVCNTFSGEPLAVQIAGNNPSSLPQVVKVGSTGGLLTQPTEYPTFSIIAPDVTVGFNKSLLSLHLASTSDKLLKNRAIYLRNSQTGSAGGAVIQFTLERFTSHSGGTVLTPKTRDTFDVLPTAVTSRTGGTITGNDGTYETRWNWSSDDWSYGAVDTESYQIAFQNTFPIYTKSDPSLKPYTLRPGQGLHLMSKTNSTSGKFDIIFVFTVEDD